MKKRRKAMGQAEEVTFDVLRARMDPRYFLRKGLGFEAWSKQVEIAEAVRDAMWGQGPKWVAVRSGNGVGKTAIAARVMLWAARCWQKAVVITTAPTSRQVNELLWREARSAFHRAPAGLGGEFYEGQARWEIGDNNFALGLSPEHTQPERFHGFHAERIVFIVDEASGVPEAHWEAMKGSALAGKAVILAIGNPTRLRGVFTRRSTGRRRCGGGCTFRRSTRRTLGGVIRRLRRKTQRGRGELTTKAQRHEVGERKEVRRTSPSRWA